MVVVFVVVVVVVLVVVMMIVVVVVVVVVHRLESATILSPSASPAADAIFKKKFGGSSTMGSVVLQ